ncbi:bifunctional 3-deoxy-7-phosphoheptulonate synthase/chorismate mutase type II [Blattabacterium cuenoti]|nr:bifunctional 3-deoxy-7-phosphoheptulonate synthase/chorismate mutase type II [Blattabacterium cuenoti]
MEKNIINNKIDRSWIDKFNKPITISGPCSAESEAQVLETAKRLDNKYINIFRAGIWKPRTKPNNFEGIGEKGLHWLQKVKQDTGYMVATEVANEKHVKLALSFDIDILWIGARSTASPFIIQEIADSLEGNKEIIILVKNPIHPDLELWIGALERLFAKGIRKLGVIHRGFYTYNNSRLRNQPNWNILLKFRKMFSRIPLICDPSHICGNKTGIYDIAKIAYHLFKYDGFMIESHCDPLHAWSDVKQQMTPEEVTDLLRNLKYTKNKKQNDDQASLNSLRILIDEIDDNMIYLLSERMKISKQLGILKKTKYLSFVQPDRWKYILTRSLKLGQELGISESIIENFFKLLHEESINIQKNM